VGSFRFWTTADIQPDPNPQLASELLQILTDLYISYPAIVTRPSIQTPAIESLVSILDSARYSIRKRAIPTISALVSTDPKLFDKPVKGRIVQKLSQGGESARVWVGVIASLARGQSVGKMGDLVGEGRLIGMILDQSSDPQQTEAVEGSLAVSCKEHPTMA
jgi:cullin-associated NEDD8-dissociated protein 1